MFIKIKMFQFWLIGDFTVSTCELLAWIQLVIFTITNKFYEGERAVP